MYRTLLLSLIKANEEKFKAFSKEQIDNFDIEKIYEIINSKVTAKDKPKTNYGLTLTEPNESGEYKILVELPGFQKNEIDIEVGNDEYLYITAKNENRNKKYSILLGKDDVLKSTLELGILTIFVQGEKQKSKKINID